MDEGGSRSFRFEGYRIDFVRRSVLAPDGSRLLISNRAYDVLAHLIEHRDRVVSKGELMAAVWAGVIVEDNNLSQAVSALRRALGDHRDAPRFIATIAGRGYRFVADVTPDGSGAASRSVQPDDNGHWVPGAPDVAFALALPSIPATGPGVPTAAPVDARAERSPLSQRRRWLLLGVALVAVGGVLWTRIPAAPKAPPRTIAVLPFQPLLDDADHKPLTLGLADALINRLSGLPGMVVAPFSAVRGYSNGAEDPLAAGRALGVDAVLESNVQILDERVRLTSRLLDVETGTALWSGRFDERLDDFFLIQDALAQQVVLAMEVELSQAARPAFP